MVTLNGKKIQNKGDTCIHIADSLYCAVETNNIVKQLYLIKISFFFLKGKAFFCFLIQLGLILFALATPDRRPLVRDQFDMVSIIREEKEL